MELSMNLITNCSQMINFLFFWHNFHLNHAIIEANKEIVILQVELPIRVFLYIYTPWKALTAQNVQNAYILEGGVNGWLAIFGEDADPKPTNYPEQSQFVFTAALGDRCVASDPDAHEWELEYTPKVQLAEKRGPSTGGCG